MPTLIDLSRELADLVELLRFSLPVSYVYNPLIYARTPHEAYLSRYGSGNKRVIFWGMNPGPWGMAQTGVPFGEVAAVRDWMGIEAQIGGPENEHPKRPVEGFACARSEVSGRRLWGLMAARFGTAADFFEDNLVMNYCPLVFMESSGRNLTPNKLPAKQRTKLFASCDRHLAAVVALLGPQWLIGIGNFALSRIRAASELDPDAFSRVRTASILHPSPASPRANQGWASEAERTLVELGVWTA